MHSRSPSLLANCGIIDIVALAAGGWSRSHDRGAKLDGCKIWALSWCSCVGDGNQRNAGVIYRGNVRREYLARLDGVGDTIKQSARVPPNVCRWPHWEGAAEFESLGGTLVVKYH